QYIELAASTSGEALEALKVTALHQIEIFLGGMVAENLYQDQPDNDGFLGDFIKVCDLLGVLLDIPASKAAEDAEDDNSLLKVLIENVQYTIKQHWAAVRALAKALLEKTDLTGDEVRQIIRTP